MKKLNFVIIMMLTALLLLACQPAVGPGPVTTAPTAEPTTEASEEPTTADSAHFWLMEQWWDDLPYEEFCSREVVFDRSCPNSVLKPDGTEVFWVLLLDQEGFCIRDSYHNGNLIARIPNTADLSGCKEYETNGVNIYVQNEGVLLAVSVETGERSILYTADAFRGNLILANGNVLYFLSVSDGILYLNRLYLPTMTLDQLYSQPEDAVPAGRYFLYPPETNRSQICWETVNPDMWKIVLEVQEDPNHPYRNIGSLKEHFDAGQIAGATDRKDEYSVLIFNALEGETNLRSRLKMCYDPQADTCTRLYGVFDACFFASSVHEDSEHFTVYPEVIP